MNDPFKSLPREEEKNIAIMEQTNVSPSTLVVPVGYKGILVRKEISQELIETVELLTEELKGITAITSQETMDAANAVLKKSKRLIKDLEADRKKMDQILNDEKSNNAAIENKIVGELAVLTDAVNKSITFFLQEEDRKAKERQRQIEEQRQKELAAAQAERDRVAKIKATFMQFENNVLNAINTATLADIDQKITTMNTVVMPEVTFQEFLPEAEIKYNELKAKFLAKKTDLLRLADLESKNKEQAAQLAEQQRLQAEAEAKALEERQRQQLEEQREKELNDTANIQMEAELKTALSGTVQGGAKVWKFDETTVDLSLLPIEYHTFDAKKIKEAITAGAREIPGVRIFQEIRNVSR
jgi:hypothetical protein